jgi:Tfp pilus assembly protein PilF
MADNLTMRVRGLSACAVLSLALAGCASTPHQELAQTVGLRQQATQAYAGGDLPTALEAYEALTRMTPSVADDWFRLGNILARIGRPEQATEAYRQALQREPAHAKAWHNLGTVLAREAEAAFAQSARVAGADSSLQKQSGDKLRALAAIIPPAGSQEPQPAHDGGQALPQDGNMPASPSSAAAAGGQRP